ncbi:MAG: hypothetical protein ACLFUS_00565 [Candidatus Sumerlaeia bacterium]
MWRRIGNLIRKVLQLEPRFLCDSCKYDHPHVCRRPERPNAVECPDYKKKGS